MKIVNISFSLFLIFAGNFILTSCNSTGNKNQKPEVYFPQTEWRTSSPESQGVNPEKLQKAFDFMAKAAGNDLSHAIVIKNGYAIFKGDSSKYKVDTRCNAVLLSLVSGILWDDGKFQLEDNAFKYEERLNCEYDEYKRIKIKHFLTRTSGYDAQGGRFHWDKLDGSLTPFKPAKPFHEPGVAVSGMHDAGNMYALVLTKIAGVPLDDILENRIMKPLGIEQNEWNWGDFGIIDGIRVNKEGENLFDINAEAFAKLGYLMLKNGQWNGHQVISEKWIEDATTSQISADIGLEAKSHDRRGHYGYFFSTNLGYDGITKKVEKMPKKMFFFKEWKNNMLVVIPEWDMVFIRLSNEEDDKKVIWDDKLNEFFNLLADAVMVE